jgi:replicative DNA helicase
VGACLKRGDSDSITTFNPEYLLNEEVGLHNFISGYFIEFSELPSRETLKSRGFSIPLERECEDKPLYYAKQIYDRFKLNLVQKSNIVLSELVANRNLDELESELSKLVLALQNCSSTDGSSDFASVLKAQLAEKEQALYGVSETKRSFSFGFEWLNDITGGFQEGELISILARPGEGKTSIALHMVLSFLEQEAKVLVVSGEMTRDELVGKMACYLAGLDYNLYRKNYYDTFRINKVKKILTDLVFNHSQLLLLDPAGTDKQVTVKEIERSIVKFKPHVLFIDAVYLFDADSSKGFVNPWDKVSKTLNALKSIAIRHKVRILITGQFSKTAEKKKGGSIVLGDAADTDTFGKVCNIVLGITSGEIKNTRKIVVLKSRFGPGKGDVYDIWYKPESRNFSDYKSIKDDLETGDLVFNL